MSEIKKLIRVTNDRNRAKDYTLARFRTLRTILSRFRIRTMEDGISGNVVIEACMNGYVNSHPAVLAMVDQWIRDTTGEEPPVKTPSLNKKDLNEIYAASQRGLKFDDDEEI